MDTEVPDYAAMVDATTKPEGRQKRLTLDMPAELHRTLKLRAVELEVPMAELLRELILDALDHPQTLRRVVSRVRRDV
ncbi:MAG: hypothetical protein M3396_05270 [Actinomycetota bacterium]|nr:hypothetical protein [Actinomycetota bacterium]